MPRTILYTGKGGVGKTSVAACTALRCAKNGMRTLILSTDPAHSLSDALEQPLRSADGDPVAAGQSLWGLEIDATAELTRHWGGVQAWLGDLLTERGVDRIAAEELTVPPGIDELLALLQLHAHHASGRWDVIVVDCAPTGETLRMLSFPEVAHWWLSKAFGSDQRLIAIAGPLARSVLDLPLPSPAALADIDRFSRHLIAMSELLRDSGSTTVRLVMNPDRMVIGEAMRTFTYLNLYGFLTDAVIVNRVFPGDVGSYFEHWREVQEQNLALVRSAFSPVPVLTAPYFDQEVVGRKMLERLGRHVFGGQEAAGEAPADPCPATGQEYAADAAAATDPAAILHSTITQSLSSTPDGAVLRIAVPLAERDQISLKQVGRELVVSAAGHRRTIALPPAIAAMSPTGARFVDGALEVSFTDA